MVFNNVFTHISTDNCCGCGACVNVCPTKAIEYSENKYGFLLPKIDELKCISCGKCKKVCPILNINVNDGKHAFAATNKNGETIKMSSSGGIFYQLALEILEQNGYVFGCTIDENMQVKHICIDSKKDLGLITKSKYVQSFLGDTFCDIKLKLQAGSKVLFCGTPCQVAALINFVDNRFKENLLTIDIVCHGVPSQKFFDAYIKFLEAQKRKKIVEYTFRYKRSSRDGMNWYSSYRYEKGRRKIINWPEDSYNYYYMKGAIYRNSCYQCIYAQEKRPGDITLCDYWGYEDLHKEFTLNDSVSGIVINTAKGAEILRGISLHLDLYKTDLQHLISNNGCMKAPVKFCCSDGNILDLWEKNGYKAVDRQFKMLHRKARVKYKIMRHIPKKIIYFLKRK